MVRPICWLPRRCLVFAIVALCVGCGKGREVDEDAARRQIASSPRSTARVVNVAILGDQTRVNLLRNLAAAGRADLRTVGESQTADIQHAQDTVRISVSSADTATAQGRLAWGAEIVLLAVNAADGPLPIHREHVLVARQMDVPEIAIAFTNRQMVDDPELLELEELELRELLNSYELPGDSAVCLFDRTPAGNAAGDRVPTGAGEIVSALATLARARPTEVLSETQRLPASVYVLEHLDGTLRFPAGGSTVLMRGKTFPAKVVGAATMEPGSVVDVEIVFKNPVQLAEVQRFALLQDSHVAALGVFVPDL